MARKTISIGQKYQIQLKRRMDYEGSYADAVARIKVLDPPLRSGEPMICSYLETPDSSVYSYFLAVGRNLRTDDCRVVSSPLISKLYANIDDIDDIYDGIVEKYLFANLDVADISTWLNYADVSVDNTHNKKLTPYTQYRLLVVDGVLRIVKEETVPGDPIDSYIDWSEADLHFLRDKKDPETDTLVDVSAGNIYAGVKDSWSTTDAADSSIFVTQSEWNNWVADNIPTWENI